MEDTMPIGLRFSLLHRSFKKKMDELLSEKELTGVQFGVLGALGRLDREKGEVSQRDLERATRLSHPTMTGILRRLEKKGFLCWETSRRDRRCKSIRLTDKARALKTEVIETENATFRWLTRGLSREQLDELISITDLMLENVLESCGKGCACTRDQDLC